MEIFLKERIEQAVNSEQDFNMKALMKDAWHIFEDILSTPSISAELRTTLGKLYPKLSAAIFRNVFLIELVKVPKIETTKFRTRWFNQLEEDPRYCSYDECLKIALELFVALPEWLKLPAHLEVLNISLSNGLIPYEIPLDYKQRTTPTGRIHEHSNLSWFYSDLILRTLKLRKYLMEQQTSPDSFFFRKVLIEKIKIKTYLTDRVLTGLHKTNREKRWETHPNSVHFANRETCMAIEYVLVTQICSFQRFPLAAIQQLQSANILPINLPHAVCPVTGDILDYNNFHDELSSPVHGKSSFQVGHLNPLKLGAIDSTSIGHAAENISWISADGNRIQGSLSLVNVRALIQRITENYKRLGWSSPQ